MEGKVRGLWCLKERGQPGIPVEEAVFFKGVGMEGDCHASGGKRQVTLLSGTVCDWMKAQAEPGLCFRRFKANIESEGLDVENLAPGTVLTAGTAALRVSESCKECFPECSLFQNGKECRLSSGGIFLEVIRTGKVSKNDKIVIGGVEK